MLEFLLCSVLTILPDYLFRRYRQGKRIGKEITLFSVWYELRFGITACLILTVMVITVIFYFHPSTTSAVSFYRTVSILPEAGGRVAEVLVTNGQVVEEGQPLFRLDNAQQTAAVESARRRVGEYDADIELAEADLLAAQARVREAESAYDQAFQELETRTALEGRNSTAVSAREIERQQIALQGRQAAVDSAKASAASAKARVVSVLPAQKASAEAALAEAQVKLDITTIRAGVAGRLEQFNLRVGEIVNPMLRPAGILVPRGAGKLTIIAGFDQIEAQVLKPGMAAEVLCVSTPFTVIPMIVTDVQQVIATGQVRASDQIVDPMQARVPGSIVTYLEPLYAGGLDKVMPGSSCIANVYTSNHERLATEDMSTAKWLALHGGDATAVVHAGIIRVQALMLPIRTLVLQGH
jgi:multidrug resistance efflux pump